MKKLLLGVVLIIAVLALATIWYTGNKVEELFRQQVAELNSEAPDQLNITIDAYQRSFFSASSTTSGQSQTLGTFQLQHKISHCPWRVHMLTTLVDMPLLAEITQVDQPPHGLQIESTFGVINPDKATVEIDDWQLPTAAGVLSLNGLSAIWEQSKQRLSLSLPLLSFHGPELNLDLKGIQLNSSEPAQGPLSSDFQLNELSLAVEDQTLVQLHDISSTSATEEDGERWKSTGEMSVGRASLLGEIFDTAAIHVTLTDLDKELYDQIQSLSKQLHSETLLNPQSDVPLELLGEIMALYLKLANSGLTVTLDDLTLKQQQAQLKASGQLTLPDSTENGFNFSLSTANLLLEFDKPVFTSLHRLYNYFVNKRRSNKDGLDSQADMLLQQTTQLGILINEGERYKLDGSLQDGQLTINGKPSPL